MNLCKCSLMLAITCLIVLLGGCSDNDSPESDPKKFTFDVPVDGIASYADYWIILSDEAGKVHDTQKLVAGTAYTYTTGGG